jgi:hypothetical protein
MARRRCEWCRALFGKDVPLEQVYCSHSCAAKHRHFKAEPTTSKEDVDLVNASNERYRQDEQGQWWYYGAKHRTRARIRACAVCARRFLYSVYHRHEVCSKSCGQKLFNRENPERFRGDNSKRWKGGRQVRRGYVFLHRPDHPVCQGNRRSYVAEHRLVMEELLGRYLRPDESVHHKNGIRDDNSPENLELWVKHQPYGQRATEQKHCPTCTCGVTH